MFSRALILLFLLAFLTPALGKPIPHPDGKFFLYSIPPNRH